MGLSKTVFRKKDFFNGGKSKVAQALRAADPEGKFFKNPKRMRGTVERLKKAGMDGKVTGHEMHDVMKDVFGTYHVSGAVRREVVKNLGLPEITRGDIARYSKQGNALQKALGHTSRRSDLPQVQKKPKKDENVLPPVHNIPVKGEDSAKNNRNEQVQRMNSINQQAAQNIVTSADGYVGNAPSQNGASSTPSHAQPPTFH